MRILKFAIELRFKPNERSFRYSNTALHIAVTHKRLDITRYLLDNGADVEAYNIFWETPLFSAIESKKIEQAIILLQYGAEIDSRNRDDNTVLHILCSQEEGIDMEMCEFLIDCGLDPNLTGKFGQTPLHMLAKNNKAPHALECAKLLIEKGVDVNSKNVFGETALHNLADYCEDYTPFFELLLKSGTETKIINHFGNTFLDILLLDEIEARRQQILKHLIILDFTGNFQYNVDITSINNIKDLLFQYYCIQELNLLETYKIAAFQTVPEYSYMKILISTNKEVSKFGQNPIIQSIFSEFDEQQFPIYGCDLKKKIQSGLRLFFEEERAYEFLSIISKGVLHYDVMIEIMKYVQAQELSTLQKYLLTKPIESVSSKKHKEGRKENIKKSKKVKKVKINTTKYKTRRYKNI
ncbi:uncharacterized protein LOC123680240 [Harmonia axyridis]|uniref:uncharacterized protein LOC123680240 n=1 Tax=Harmonia axyridis TaxID=115357 RepID=UPI001E277EA4|nr:uncharacterized protein LOC123680240 [Harmonia axyridis]